jgi:Skp family chaperone for outer membrane proteins
MSGKIICPKCHGNGYIKFRYSDEHNDSVMSEKDCIDCNNKGEVDITEEVLAMLEASGRRLV